MPDKLQGRLARRADRTGQVIQGTEIGLQRVIAIEQEWHGTQVKALLERLSTFCSCAMADRLHY